MTSGGEQAVERALQFDQVVPIGTERSDDDEWFRDMCSGARLMLADTSPHVFSAPHFDQGGVEAFIDWVLKIPAVRESVDAGDPVQCAQARRILDFDQSVLDVHQATEIILLDEQIHLFES